MIEVAIVNCKGRRAEVKMGLGDLFLKNEMIRAERSKIFERSVRPL